MNFFNSYELNLLYNLQSIVRGELLDRLMPRITSLANAGIFWIVLALVLLIFKKTRKIGITMALSLLLGFIVGNLIVKPLVARVRPYDFDSSIALLISPEHDYSFPSGHTLASFEGAVSIFLYHKKSGVAAIALAFLIAFSRLYLMVHYPSDVIVGAVLGSLFAYTAYRITLRFVSKNDIGL